MPFWRFFTAILVATLPKSLILVGIGWIFGEAWRESDWSYALVALVILGLIAAMLYFRRKKEAVA